MIKAAAIKDESGKIWTLPAPNRHHHIIALMNGENTPEGRILVAAGTQGFITDSGQFVDRIEGGEIAKRAQQITNLRWPPNLYSEDLW